MKVSKLIEQLQKLDGDSIVYVSSDGINYEVAVQVDEDDGDAMILGEIKRSY